MNQYTFEHSSLTGFDCELSESELSKYLQKRERPLKSILNKQNLHKLGEESFLYRASPQRILSFTLTPRVLLSTRWHLEALVIVFEECKIEGLGEWQDRIVFRCQATLTPREGHLMALATAELKIDASGSAALIPPILIRQASMIALTTTLDRLGQRFRSRMHKDVERWKAKSLYQ